MTQYQDIDRAGNFRGEIIEYGIAEQKSGAVAISVDARVDECWNSESETWVDWHEYNIHVIGNIYIVKKDGKLLDNNVKSLSQFAGWDGSLDSVANKSWQPTPCQFVVNEETYNGQTKYRISFINDYHRAPGAMGQLSPDRLKELNAKFGSSLRAVAGVAKTTPKPNGAPKAPPKSAQKPQPVAADHGDPPEDMDIPF